MATNTNLTNELAVRLVKFQSVECPNCGGVAQECRYSYKSKNTEYKCLACGEIYLPCKLI